MRRQRDFALRRRLAAEALEEEAEAWRRWEAGARAEEEMTPTERRELRLLCEGRLSALKRAAREQHGGAAVAPHVTDFGEPSASASTR